MNLWENANVSTKQLGQMRAYRTHRSPRQCQQWTLQVICTILQIWWLLQIMSYTVHHRLSILVLQIHQEPRIPQRLWTNNPGADPGFQVRGPYLNKLRRAEGGAKMFGVFRVKNHAFTPKNLIFSNFRGRAPGAPPWIRSCNHPLPAIISTNVSESTEYATRTREVF